MKNQQVSSRLVLAIITSVIAVVSACAQTNFHNVVTRMWLEGNKSDIYCIATNRLAANTNDLAGLVMKMSYELAFSDFNNYTNTLQRLITAGRSVSTTNFALLYPMLEFEQEGMSQLLTTVTTNELTQWVQKGSITNKPMTYRRFLYAIEIDGLLNN